MKRVCAWCQADIGGETKDGEEANPLTHGICEGCYAEAISELGTPLKQFLDSLPFPTLLVDEDAVVEAAARDGFGIVGKASDEVTGRRIGEVFECVNSALPGGCGLTIHCSGCVLRGTVTKTYETGESQVRVPATLQVPGPGRPPEVALFVTTERVGDRVLVRIETS